MRDCIPLTILWRNPPLQHFAYKSPRQEYDLKCFRKGMPHWAGTLLAQDRHTCGYHRLWYFWSCCERSCAYGHASFCARDSVDPGFCRLCCSSSSSRCMSAGACFDGSCLAVPLCGLAHRRGGTLGLQCSLATRVASSTTTRLCAWCSVHACFSLVGFAPRRSAHARISMGSSRPTP